ncbi:PepSY domain-containing protein [Bradyrhizobium sp. CCGUVB23]|uniref:PepSY domain-containing protein n=1 Tax=Bradyrhizobium sp. CCGUVB23 TaxID=2949630 RepID=UPI0020B3B0FD|nr:PepSY domain-containing protein [Bradyrhizobium sp. CCGUVB23]MCP3466722.1 PepSY domain-containing protein [Bradyrhizobium sp. CCGUVB23]
MTAPMRAPKRWKSLLVLALLAVLLPAPVYATTASIDARASLRSEADDGAVLDQRAVERELARFRGSAISLRQAMAIAEAQHAGSTTADVSFDGAAASPVYRVKTLHNDRVWQHAIDATTGKIVGGAAASPLDEFDADDRSNLATLKTIQHRLADAVRVAEHAASGKAISGGMVREGGRLNFAIVVMSGNDLKEVILEPPGAASRR